MKRKDLLDLQSLTPAELRQLLDLTHTVKREPERYRQALTGKNLALIFQKASTRTRVSFEVGMVQLGGHALVLPAQELQLGRGESIEDTAAVLSRYVDGIMARVHAHRDLITLARHATVPVINGLSDLTHPCQAICDYFTIEERLGHLAGVRVAYVGDGNNVAHALAAGAAKLGVELTIATPPGYAPNPSSIAQAQSEAATTGARITVSHDPYQAVRGAQVVYTDVWTSMGQEQEREQRLRDFAAFRVDAILFAAAQSDALFMHCLPAHRGEEVTSEVADHPRSIIFDQAENRLHSQKALLLTLLQTSRA
ncbi:MAG: ornithine carbamoyltransferase [Proteobacteria bacterium]|nr:ornithine carbamoyltransferase [Pseudomonadota bacterium]